MERKIFDQDNMPPILEPTIQIPNLGTIDFEHIEWRVGKVETPEGESVGVVLEWRFMPLPWLKFRMHFGRLEAASLQAAIYNELRGDETETPS